MAFVTHVSSSTAGISPRNFTFILNCFLPTVYFHIENVLEIEEYAKRNMEAVNLGDDILFCGSNMEGLAIPVYWQLNTVDVNAIIPDTDILMIDNERKIFQDRKEFERSRSITELSLLMDDSACEKGFVRLRTKTGAWDYLPDVPNWFFDSGEVRKAGPAIQISHEKHSEKTHFQLSWLQRSYFSTDTVYALRLEEWPKVANEWEMRGRPSGWPSPDLRSTIMSKGCYLVKKAHPDSSHPQEEWRLSFSEAEIALARSLSSVQRKCYVLFKIAVSFSLKIDKSASDQPVLSTYHLKTVMLWLYEVLPVSKFIENTVGERYLDLLDKLIEFLIDGNLPNYFVRQNNMIRHIPVQDRQAMIRNLQQLRESPLDIFVQFDKGNKFQFSIWKDDLVDFLGRFVSDYPPHAFLYDIIIRYTKQGYYLGAIDTLIQLAALKKSESGIAANSKAILEERLLKFIIYVLSPTDPTARLFWNFCLQTFPDLKEDEVITTCSFQRRFWPSLARYLLYWKIKMNPGLSEEQAIDLSHQINLSFTEAIRRCVKKSAKDVLDAYSWLIFDQNDINYKDVNDVLTRLRDNLELHDHERVFNEVTFDIDDFYTYEKEDKYLIHDPLLKIEIEAVGKIRVPTIVYLHYLLVARAVKSKGKRSREAHRALSDMKRICNTFAEKLDNSLRFAVLGYGCMYDKYYHRASSFIYRALLLGKHFDLTLGNLCSCFEFVFQEF